MNTTIFLTILSIMQFWFCKTEHNILLENNTNKDTIYVLKTVTPHQYGIINELDISHIDLNLNSLLFTNFCYPKVSNKRCWGYALYVNKEPEFYTNSDDATAGSLLARALNPYQVNDSVRIHQRLFFKKYVLFLLEIKNNRLYVYKIVRGDSYYRRQD